MVEFSIKPAENGYIAHETREQTKTFVFDTLDEVMQEMLTAFEGRYAGLSGDSYGRVTIDRGGKEKP
jgi:hypothetical protein